MLRSELLLLSALPTAGAFLFWMLWTWRRKPSESSSEEVEDPSPTPVNAEESPPRDQKDELGISASSNEFLDENGNETRKTYLSTDLNSDEVFDFGKDFKKDFGKFAGEEERLAICRVIEDELQRRFAGGNPFEEYSDFRSTAEAYKMEMNEAVFQEATNNMAAQVISSLKNSDLERSVGSIDSVASDRSKNSSLPVGSTGERPTEVKFLGSYVGELQTSKPNSLELDHVKSELQDNHLRSFSVTSQDSAFSQESVTESQASDSGISKVKKLVAKKNRINSSKTPDPASLQMVTRMFDFPTELCGRLIGRQGRNVGIVKKKSGANIFVKAKLYTTDFQIVCIEGTQQQVSKAVSLIKKKFPEKKFTNVNYMQNLPDLPVIAHALMQLTLPLGVQLDVVISAVVAANHLFLQQRTHPTFPGLEKQTLNMCKCYGMDGCVPSLPRPLETGVICVAPVYGYWYRAQIVQTYSETDDCDIKLVDYGGYLLVPGSSLKQIRSDFMNLPFQAIECYLSNIIPAKDGETFSAEAKGIMEKLIGVSDMKAEVVAVEDDGIPYIQLQHCAGGQIHLINRELVENGVARWIEM